MLSPRRRRPLRCGQKDRSIACPPKKRPQYWRNVAHGLQAQLVDATQALNLSAGGSNCKVSRVVRLADELLYSDRLASAATTISSATFSGRERSSSPAAWAALWFG